jgi:hypothetical protein
MKKLAIGILALVASQGLAAAPISFGALSSNDDGSTEVIVDSLNGLEWLRWDILADYTYAETVAATGPGGAYEEFEIAHNAEAQNFVDAFLQGVANACATSGNSTCNDADVAPGLTGLLGDSYSTQVDLAWFLSDNGTGSEVGYIGYFDSAAPSTLLKDNEFTTIAGSDAYSASGNHADVPLPWLVYRASGGSVPVPPTLCLVALGLSLVGMRRLSNAKPSTT